jgi:hypothetical protein
MPIKDRADSLPGFQVGTVPDDDAVPGGEDVVTASIARLDNGRVGYAQSK